MIDFTSFTFVEEFVAKNVLYFLQDNLLYFQILLNVAVEIRLIKYNTYAFPYHYNARMHKKEAGEYNSILYIE